MSQPENIAQIVLGAVAISGPDAAAFVQSQLTLDIDEAEANRLYPAAWCSPDGRVDVVVLVALEDRQITLILPSTMVEAVVKRVGMYSIGRQVKVRKETHSVGPAHLDHNHKRALALSCDSDRSLAIADADNAEISGNAAWRLPVDWLRADIGCGMPWILPETSRLFLPQMLGLEALGGLSYKKGCFPGQEVIARVHYRGRVTRRLARFRLKTDRPPSPGTTFELAGKPACVLYGVAGANAAGEFDGLAVVSADAEPESDIRISDDTGALVS